MEQVQKKVKAFDVWYFRPEYSRDYLMGYNWLVERDLMPNVLSLGKTHAYVKMVNATDPEMVFRDMQAENWSPNGEAVPLIDRLGLNHTSMSVGDLIVTEEGAVLMVDLVGFVILKSGQPAHPSV